MTDQIRDEDTVLAQTEPAQVESKTEAVPAACQLPAEQKQQALALMQEIDLESSTSIITFGSDAQQQATSVSQEIIAQAKNKDLGSAGKLLNDVVTQVRGLDTREVREGKKPGFFGRLLGAIEPAAKFVQQYESASSQIDAIVGNLESHRVQMIWDVQQLDKLYHGTVEDFERLELYIAAGEERLRLLDAEEIPAAEKKAGSDQAMDVEALNQLRHMRDELERRVHDLKLTREVTLQALPQLRNHQNLDKKLAGKIKSVIVNTVPLWQQKMAQALLIDNTREAAAAVDGATQLNNELLIQNAKDTRAANSEVRAAVERGIYDMDAVEQANQELIGMIDDTLRIADEAKARRKEDAERLKKTEAKRNAALKAASSGQRPNPDDDGAAAPTAVAAGAMLAGDSKASAGAPAGGGFEGGSGGGSGGDSSGGGD